MAITGTPAAEDKKLFATLSKTTKIAVGLNKMLESLLFPHISVWGSCFSLPTPASAASASSHHTYHTSHHHRTASRVHRHIISHHHQSCISYHITITRQHTFIDTLTHRSHTLLNTPSRMHTLSSCSLSIISHTHHLLPICFLSFPLHTIMFPAFSQYFLRFL